MMPPHLIAFDLDGTLVDSLRDLSDSANEMLAHYAAPPLDEATVGSMVGEGAATLVKRVLAARAPHVPVHEALAVFLAIYDERLVRHTRPYDGIPEALQQLGASAILAVLTNKPEAASERLLVELDLRRYFRWVVGGDTPLGRKPQPRAFQAMMQSAGVAPDATVLVGDSAVDVQTARDAGTRLCVARYGFGFRNCRPELLTDDDLVVDRPKDLPPVLGFSVY
jgi:phosphoglycolate phosphatase